MSGELTTHSTGRRWLLASLAGALILGLGSAWALSVNDTVRNVQLRDAEDEPLKIPNLGKKVLTVFYTDPDEADQNDPFADLLKAAKLPKEKYQGIGVANLKDTWKPNFAIRAMVRRKIKKYNSTILTDPEHLLKKAWKLGDCNETSLVIILGPDKKVHFIKRGKMSKGDMDTALAKINELIAAM